MEPLNTKQAYPEISIRICKNEIGHKKIQKNKSLQSIIPMLRSEI